MAIPLLGSLAESVESAFEGNPYPAPHTWPLLRISLPLLTLSNEEMGHRSTQQFPPQSLAHLVSVVSPRAASPLPGGQSLRVCVCVCVCACVCVGGVADVELLQTLTGPLVTVSYSKDLSPIPVDIQLS